jgi:hypothetical protein
MDTSTAPNLDDLFPAALSTERRALDPLAALAVAYQIRIGLTVIELDAVRAARAQNWTWGEIGECLGMTKQGAQQKFGPLEQLCLYCGGTHLDGPCALPDPPYDDRFCR